MIESPRALRISVPDLLLATEWYTQAFDMKPSEARAEGVTFHVQGFTVLLVLGTPSPQTPVVYWGVDDVASEWRRLLALQTSGGQALEPLRDGTEEAIVYDPFGNAFGLTSLGDPDIRRARNQRSAEKIALRNVRETLDDLQKDELSQRSTRRVFLLAGIAIAVVLIIAVTIAIQRAKSLQSEKPITIPKLERP
ncbi:MAG: VOC family protein [Rhodoferax sp.]|nr:VOC family protein [Rhodoferax sp.]